MDFDLMWAGKGNAYVPVGGSTSGMVYRNTREYSKNFNGGVIVSEGRIVKVLSANEMNAYLSQSNQSNKPNPSEKEKQKELAQKRSTQESQENIAKKRTLAQKNIVSQALNYASGTKEDSSGYQFFYPIDITSGKCIYGLALDKSKTPAEVSMLNALTAMYTGSAGNKNEEDQIIDLNKGDISRVAFYKLNGNYPNYKIGNQWFTGDAYLKYQSRVEGLPDWFQCDSSSCSIDRLRRAWGVIASQCRGAKKAF